MQYDFIVKKITLACFVDKGMGATVHKNRPNHGLAFNINGTKEYVFKNGKKITVNANDIIYLPQNSDYTVNLIEPGACYAINFELMQEKIFNAFKIKIKNSISALEYFKTAKTNWDHRDYGYKAECKANLYSIIYMMQKEYFTQYISKSQLEIIMPAIEFIHKNYTKEMISIEFLSNKCGITPEYFRKIFKSFYGVSPLKYINKLKLSFAKELIKSGMYTISEVAMQSGYNDISYFSREFKKATGTSPMFYR